MNYWILTAQVWAMGAVLAFSPWARADSTARGPNQAECRIADPSPASGMQDIEIIQDHVQRGPGSLDELKEQLLRYHHLSPTPCGTPDSQDLSKRQGVEERIRETNWPADANLPLALLDWMDHRRTRYSDLFRPSCVPPLRAISSSQDAASFPQKWVDLITSELQRMDSEFLWSDTRVRHLAYIAERLNEELVQRNFLKDPTLSQFAMVLMDNYFAIGRREAKVTRYYRPNLDPALFLKLDAELGDVRALETARQIVFSGDNGENLRNAVIAIKAFYSKGDPRLEKERVQLLKKIASSPDIPSSIRDLAKEAAR